MDKTLHYIQQHEADFRRQLYDFLRIPSISTDPAYADEVARAARWLADELKRIGLDGVEVIATQRHPLVYGEWLGAGPDAPTVLIYGHYDVQPAELADGWESEPFEPVERDGKVYARGSTDDKGQLYAHVKAVEALLAAEGRLPVNVKFIVEGEEESGGESLAAFVKEQGQRLKADVCVISDSSMAHIDRPVIVNALRGGVAMELRVSGPRQDLHSGMYGGSVHNPLQAMAEILAKLHDADGRVSVPGFYDDVAELSAAEREQMTQVAWTEANWREETGAPAPWGEAGYSLRERISTRPTLEITGMAGGFYGSGMKSIVPAYAIAKISCRLVPYQRAEHIFECVQRYITQITPPTVHSELTKMRFGTPAVLVKTDTPAIQAAVRAYAKGWGGAPPVFMREGGSIPIVSDFQNLLGLPVVMMGFGLNSDNLHGPNEHFSLEMFRRGIVTSAHFLHEMAGV